MADLLSTTPDLFSVAGNGESPPTIVVVGEDGGVYISNSEAPYEFEAIDESERQYRHLYSVAYGNGVFIAVGAFGTVLRSYAIDAETVTWQRIEVTTTEHLRAVAYDSSGWWVAVGDGGIAMVSNDDGVTWTEQTISGTPDLRAVAVTAANATAVGLAGVCYYTTNYGSTWAAGSSDTSEDMYGIVYGGSKWVAVGDLGEIIVSTDGQTFAAATSPTSNRLLACAYGNSRWVCVGYGNDAVTSADASAWALEDSGQMRVLNGIVYTDSAFVTVGNDLSWGYSETGSESSGFDNFEPLSDIYRFNDFAVFGADILCVGAREYNETTDTWVYKPRRWRSPAAGTYNDFENGNFGDLPGEGELLTCTSVGGGFLIGESNQVSFVSPSDYTRYSYNGALRKKFWFLSHPVALGSVAYGVGPDGLLYRADSVDVSEVECGFDLRQFEDFSESDPDPIWIRADAEMQLLLIFRPESPYILHLVDPNAGSYTEFEFPPITISEVTYAPMSIDSAKAPDGNRLLVGYGPSTGTLSTLVTAVLDFGSAIIGEDEPDSGATARWHATVQTGLIRVTKVGEKAYLKELEVRTWCQAGDSVIRPDVAVEVRSTNETSWRDIVGQAGTITVNIASVACSGTVFQTHSDLQTMTLVAKEAETGTTWDVPAPVDKSQFYTKKGSTYTLLVLDTDYTKATATSIELSVSLPNDTELYQQWVGYPQMSSKDGDMVRTDEGLHLITDIPCFDEVTLAWQPATDSNDGTLVPAQQMPAGEGILTFGIDQEIEDLELRLSIVPRDDSSAANNAKILEVRLVLGESGSEDRNDE